MAQRSEEGQRDHFNRKAVNQERSLLKSAFQEGSPRKKKEKNPFLPDFYAKAVAELANRNQLPSFFNKAIQKEKERTLQPDFFNSGIFSKERTLQADHFRSKVSNKERKAISDHFATSDSKKKQREGQPDYFGSAVRGKRLSDEELEHNARGKKNSRKNFIGERLRLFNTDPNRKGRKEGKKRERKRRDPFGRDARESEQPQNPKNQMDLFDGSVLPKMKDLR